MIDKITPAYYLQANGFWRKGTQRGAGAMSLKAVLRQGGKIEGGK